MTGLLPATAHAHGTAIAVTLVGVVLIGLLVQRLLGPRRVDGRRPGRDVRPWRRERKIERDRAASARPSSPPGTQKPRRLVVRFHYELLVCGLRGHELIGTDAAELRPQDALVARLDGDTRWYRCLRCDSWLPLAAPERPARRYPPEREQVALPLRGRALRDKFVLRIIALDRALHFVILAIIAAAIFLFAANQVRLRQPAYWVLADLQSGLGGPPTNSPHGIIYELRRLFSVQSGTLLKIGMIVSVYALLEGAEAVGLWLQKRWAEYLTFIATGALIPLEIYELSHRLSPLKSLTLLINLAVVAYLLLAKRLFGLRGGARAEAAEREHDTGWPALQRTTPTGTPAATTPAPTAG